MQEKMAKALKNRASKHVYISPTQLYLPGFETPFAKSLRSDNRWVKWAHSIPWDRLVSVYLKELANDQTGAAGINPRVVIGALIIKHMCNLSDRETVQQIQENMYMQYFIGYSSFDDSPPFDPSLFVDIRKRLGITQVNAMNEIIVQLSGIHQEENTDISDKEPTERDLEVQETKGVSKITHKGSLITDATVCPQDIAFPTDLDLLDSAREKAEELIDKLYKPSIHTRKPRTYRETARKLYLQMAQRKVKPQGALRKSLRKQLAFLRRDIKSIHTLLDAYSTIPLDKKDYKYLLVIQTLYDQQYQMYSERKHSVDNRIVSIHQPHVRPIVRGKAAAGTEFGAKINISLVDGYTFLDDLGWEAYNEGLCLIQSVEKYQERLGYYPEVVMADKIYCNRKNRAELKRLGIKLRAKPLGRPRAVDVEHVRPGERNPVEGKFGQAKTRYGLNRIKARLNETSQSWIASIILVLNLVKLAGEVPYYLITMIYTYSARMAGYEENKISVRRGLPQAVYR